MSHPNIPDFINKLLTPKYNRATHEKPFIKIEVTIDDEVVFRNAGHGVVVCFLNDEPKFEITKNPDDLTMEGDSQVFGAGTSLEQLFAVDQLVTKLQPTIKLAHKHAQDIISGKEKL